jgi:hypothetical protein
MVLKLDETNGAVVWWIRTVVIHSDCLRATIYPHLTAYHAVFIVEIITHTTTKHNS